MNKDQFEICLSFHLELIRSRPLQKTIDDARNGVTTGAAGKFLYALKERFDSLTQYQSVSNMLKINIYNLNNTRNPSPGAFAGAFDVINNGTGISKAAKAHNVNYQSIKVLIPRLERWEAFAKRLHDTL